MSIRVLVVDDERLARMGITGRLKMQSDMELIGQCATGEQAVHAIKTSNPDLVFLDIEMPGMSGLEVLRRTPEAVRPAVVLLTAHRQYALQAFDLHVLDYLLKPINDDRFLVCLDRIREFSRLRRLNPQPREVGIAPAAANAPSGLLKRFVLRFGERVLFVTTAEIDWIEGVGDYVGLHVGDKNHLTRQTMAGLEMQLDPSEFVRIHRSTIVRIDRVTHQGASKQRFNAHPKEWNAAARQQNIR